MFADITRSGDCASGLIADSKLPDNCGLVGRLPTPPPMPPTSASTSTALGSFAGTTAATIAAAR